MKKFLKLFSTLMMTMIIVTCFCGNKALAEYEAESPIWLTNNEISILQGESAEIGVYTTDYISYYVTGVNSANTIINYFGSQTGGTFTITVGKDETANTFHIYVYLGDASDDCYKDLTVNVMKTSSPISAVNSSATSTISVSFADGSTGTLTLTTEKKIGLFQTASGTAMAQFSITNQSGKLMQLTLGDVVTYNGANYITVKTPAAGTINISSSDKAVLQAQGIAGLYLNNKYVNWP
ncbi:MAG: hypothetical protein K6A23_14955 [Butyrivibrio sp.]|nr:hypothetical protein [Butyrivibrio sp.]